MIPKLYDEDYLLTARLEHGDTNKNGYGFLNTCQKCIVEEKTNGVYTIELELLTSDKYAEYVLPNTFIKVIPNKSHAPQLFQVYRVKESGNKISVSGNHIKYLALNNMISRYNIYKDTHSLPYLTVNESESGTVQAILGLLYSERNLLLEEFSNSDPDIPAASQKRFSITSNINDVTGTVNFRFFADKLLGEFLYDKEYGMGKFGGEWLYDNFNLTLLKKRGKSEDEAVYLRHGYEVKNMSIEYSSDNNYNIVVPYGKVIDKKLNDERAEFYLSGEPDYLPTDELYKYPRIKTVDVSEHLPELIVTAQSGLGMDTAFQTINDVFNGQYYRGKYKARGYEIAVSAELNYNSKAVQELGLYDSVVLITKSGKSITSRVEGVKFDALNERIINIDLGNKPLTLQDMIGAKRR